MLRWASIFRSNVFLFFIAATLLTLGSAEAATPTPTNFAMKNGAFLFELGPKGERLAMVRRDWKIACANGEDDCDDDERRYRAHDDVLIVDAEQMKVVDTIKVGDTISINWMEWTDSETLLMSISTGWKFDNGKIYYPVSRVMSVRLDGTRDPVFLFQDEHRILKSNSHLNRVVSLLRDDSKHILMGAYRKGDHDLFRVNVETGQAERVAKGKDYTTAWYANRDGNPSMRFDCKNRYCRTIYVMRPEEGANPNDEKTKWTRVRTFEIREKKGEDELEFQPLAFGETSDEYYVLAEDEESGRSEIKIYNLKEARFTQTIAKDPQYDIANAFFYADTGEYAGYVVWRDRVHYVLTDSDDQADIDRLTRHFGDTANVSVVNASHDGQRAVIYVSAPHMPGAYYLYDYDTRELDFLTTRSPSLPETLSTQTEVLSLPMRDGSAITGYLTKPADAVSAPLIVLLHGGPEARDLLAYDGDTQFLASRGYQVLRMNFRGSSGYGRDFAKAGYGQWGGLMNDDVIDAVTHVQRTENVLPDRTCIMGHSYGGYAALYAGAKHADMFSCIIAGAAPTDLRKMLKTDRKKFGRSSGEADYLEQAVGHLDDDRDRLDATSPINLIGMYDDPILLIHGENDNVVEADQSDDMRKALKDQEKVFEYIEFENSGHYHDNWTIETRTNYFDAVEAFLKKHLPPD